MKDTEPSAASAAPAEPPAASGAPNPEDLDKMLNWALLHKDQKLACAFMHSCSCSSRDNLACTACTNTQGSPLKLKNAFAASADPDASDEEDESEFYKIVNDDTEMLDNARALEN